MVSFRSLSLMVVLASELLLSPGATALSLMGTKDGGGGIGFVCGTGELQTVHLADTYDALQAGLLKGLENLTEEQVFLAAGRELNEPLLAGWLYLIQNNQLRYVPSGKLELLGDDNLLPGSIPNGCSKVQLAIQNLQNGVVNYDENLVDKMSPTERSLLRLHETFVHIRNSPGEDTTAIRDAVAKIVESPAGSFEKFIRILANPDSAFPSTVAYDERQWALIEALPGEYQGRDARGTACAVSVIANGGELDFTIQNISVRNIQREGLAQKLADDTEFRKREDRNFYAGRDVVNFYRYGGTPSPFGIYPFTESVGINWLSGELESISVGSEVSSGGPFRNPNSRSELWCFGLQKR